MAYKKKQTTNSFNFYQTAVKAIQAEQFKLLYVLAGEERFLVSAVLEKLKAQLGLASDLKSEIDAHVIDIDAKTSNLDWPSITSECQMPPFMAKKRLLLIKQSKLFQQALGVEKQAAWQTFMQALCQSKACVCVFLEDKIDQRLKHCQALSKSQDCAIYNFSYVEQPVLAVWLANELKKLGLKITNSALTSLLERSNCELFVLQNELRKLKLYCQANNLTAIDMNVVDQLLQRDMKADIFDLLDAVSAKNLAKAKAIMSILQANKQVFLVTLLLLGRHMRELLVAKTRPDLLTASPWKVNKLKAQARQFTAQELSDMIRFCADCDTVYKSSYTDELALSDLLLAKLVKTDLDIKFAELAI